MAKVKKTPVSRITSVLRRIWLYSPERSAVLKRTNYVCEECGTECAKSRAESKINGKPHIEIHHVEPCDLTKLAKGIHAKMFPGADKLDGLCTECHRTADELIRAEHAKG